MTQLLEVCEDPDREFELRKKIGDLHQKQDQLVLAHLSSETQKFKDSVAGLEELAAEAQAAKKDLDKVAVVIAKASKAVGRLEKLMKNTAAIL